MHCGQVLWPEHFLLTCAGFAVVDCVGRVISHGPVHQWAIGSYTAELLAVLVAFCESSQPVQLHCDCKTLVDQLCIFTQTQTVDVSWPLQRWWHALANVWLSRKEFCPEPLIAKWVPAHKLESIPEHLIDYDMARANGSTVLDIVNNRKADHAAKKGCSGKLVGRTRNVPDTVPCS